MYKLRREPQARDLKCGSTCRQTHRIKSFAVLLAMLVTLVGCSDANDENTKKEVSIPVQPEQVTERAVTPEPELGSEPEPISEPTPAELKPAKTSIEAAITPQIAIVIDDLGYALEPGRALTELPYPITLAVIPGTPHSKQIAEMTSDSGHELILHVPMQPKGVEKWEDGLDTKQNKDVFLAKLENMLDAYPRIKGINNHGGSLLTADEERMNWVMSVLQERHLFFLDSRTTSESKAIAAAQSHQLLHLSRDVFLDNELSDEGLNLAFSKLRHIARKHGRAVAIGHPHPITINYLYSELPKLVEEGFQLTYSSELLESPNTED